MLVLRGGVLSWYFDFVWGWCNTVFRGLGGFWFGVGVVAFWVLLVFGFDFGVLVWWFVFTVLYVVLINGCVVGLVMAGCIGVCFGSG